MTGGNRDRGEECPGGRMSGIRRCERVLRMREGKKHFRWHQSVPMPSFFSSKLQLNRCK